jgi:hypothetical protein
MHLRKRALALVFVATAAFTALGSQAMAAPMPWETSKTPTAVTPRHLHDGQRKRHGYRAVRGRLLPVGDGAPSAHADTYVRVTPEVTHTGYSGERATPHHAPK